MNFKFDFESFGEYFVSFLKYGDSLRSIGDEIGVSASTLSRLRHGKPVDVDTLINVIEWTKGTKTIHDFVKRN